jgi:uncharacterized membrane protein YhaH (DUF805 family)
MTIGELVFWYASVFFVLLLALIVMLLRHRASHKPVFRQPDWRSLLAHFRGKVPRGEFWLKIFVATFIALTAGVIIAVFVLPYGTALALGTLSVTGAVLVYLVPRLLA